MANKDGLRYPSIDQLLSQIDSKYKLAYTAALRAKAINEHKDENPESECSKPVGMALEEIQEGKIKIDFIKKS